MKIIHFADLHFRPADKDLALASLDALIATGEEQKPDLFVFSGDLFDRAIHNTKNSGLPDLIDAFVQLDLIAPIVAVTGTPTHDVAGCYHPIMRACDNHGFYMLEPGEAYFLADGMIYAAYPAVNNVALILGVPEPSKEWFLAGKALGRDASNVAVVNGMRELLLGLGAIRKKYAELPCVLVYHGQIEGASMANGQVLPPGGIAIGRDDLALVGADYYAFGDIHLAQQIGDLPAYYPGSCYPVNWGETDQKGFNVVDIGGYVIVDDDGGNQWHECELTRHPFPHPPRKKIVVTLREFDNTYWPEKVGGYQAWVVIRDLSEAVTDLDMEYMTDKVLIRDYGALPGSRVTKEVIPTETVRAGEIADAQTLRAKVEVWADNSAKDYSDAILEKADTLELRGRSEGVTSDGLHIRIDRLILRGAIGTWKGLGVDDVELDLTNREGLQALIGRNGAGKTTIIENMHPFPEMLTRSGKLADHFRLRDSARDLYFTDARTGDAYRAYIQIDGAGQAGKCDYHLYKNGTPVVNGRKADYEEKIGELFGSLSLFLRSAFSSQKPSRNAPDLAEATKGEKKALFRELGGLDYLQFYADTAKMNAKGLETDLIKTQTEIDILENITFLLPEKRHELTVAETSLGDLQTTIRTLEAEGKAKSAEVDALDARVTAHHRVVTQLEELNGRASQLRDESEAIKTANEQRAELLKALPGIRGAIERHEDLTREEAKLNEEKTRTLEERERINTEFDNRLAAFQEDSRAIEHEKAAYTAQLARLDQDKIGLLKDVDRLQERLNNKITCPECGHDFAIGAKGDEEQLGQAQTQVWELDKTIEQVKENIEKGEKILTGMLRPEPPELPKFEQATRLKEIQDSLTFSGIDVTRRKLADSEKAGTQIEEGEKRLEAIFAETVILEGQIRNQTPKLDPDAEEAQTEAIRILETFRGSFLEAKTTASGMGAGVEAAKRDIEELERKVTDLKEKRRDSLTAQIEVAEWRWLEQACGVDGIQALELDAMGPGIAEVANRILEAAYGSRFVIEFRTTRMAGTGSKTKQVEDFQIVVHDTERGEEQLLETLSGGETVWIRRAIYDAFGIIRDRSTGQRFLTVFQDESDGALDPEARVAYFRMLEASHVESGRRHTIIVTHSETAQQMIPQHIVMSELGRMEA